MQMTIVNFDGSLPIIPSYMYIWLHVEESSALLSDLDATWVYMGDSLRVEFEPTVERLKGIEYPQYDFPLQKNRSDCRFALDSHSDYTDIFRRNPPA